MPSRIQVTMNDTVLHEYIGAIPRKSQQWALGTGEDIKALARGLVAKDTGSLEDTIDFEPFEGAGLAGVVVFAGDNSGGYRGSSKKAAGKPVDYAEDEEFGTFSHSSAPFMTPAAEQAWPTAIERLGAMLAVI